MLMELVTRLVSPQKNSKTFREGKTMDEFMQASIEATKKGTFGRWNPDRIGAGDYARPRSTLHACSIWSRETS